MHNKQTFISEFIKHCKTEALVLCCLKVILKYSWSYIAELEFRIQMKLNSLKRKFSCWKFIYQQYQPKCELAAVVFIRRQAHQIYEEISISQWKKKNLIFQVLRNMTFWELMGQARQNKVVMSNLHLENSQNLTRGESCG